MNKIVPNDALLVPAAAKKVYQGTIFSTYHWDQQMYDGSTQVFEMLKRTDTVDVLAVHDNKIVLIVDEQPGRGPIIGFPGGRVDPGEDWLTAGNRELLEETGYSFEDLKLVNVLQPVHKIEWFTVLYLASSFVSLSEQSTELAGEKIEIRLVDFDEFMKLASDPNNKRLYQHYEIFKGAASLGDITVLHEFKGRVVDR